MLIDHKKQSQSEFILFGRAYHGTRLHGGVLHRLQAKKELNIGRILYKSLSQSIRETVITPPHSARYGAEIRRRRYEIYCFIVSFISFHRPIYIISSPRNIGFQCPKPSIWGKKRVFVASKEYY